MEQSCSIAGCSNQRSWPTAYGGLCLEHYYQPDLIVQQFPNICPYCKIRFRVPDSKICAACTCGFENCSMPAMHSIGTERYCSLHEPCFFWSSQAPDLYECTHKSGDRRNCYWHMKLDFISHCLLSRNLQPDSIELVLQHIVQLAFPTY